MRGGSRLCFCVYSILFFLYLHTLTVLKWTDEWAWIERKAWKATKPQSHTKTERLLSIQMPTPCEQHTSFFLHFTKTSNKKYYNSMQICRVNSIAEKEGTKRDKGWKRDSEEGESWLTVCRWFIIVIIWRGFLLTTRPTLVLLSFSSHLLPVCRSHWHIFK